MMSSPWLIGVGDRRVAQVEPAVPRSAGHGVENRLHGHAGNVKRVISNPHECIQLVTGAQYSDTLVKGDASRGGA